MLQREVPMVDRHAAAVDGVLARPQVEKISAASARKLAITISDVRQMPCPTVKIMIPQITGIASKTPVDSNVERAIGAFLYSCRHRGELYTGRLAFGSATRHLPVGSRRHGPLAVRFSRGWAG